MKNVWFILVLLGLIFTSCAPTILTFDSNDETGKPIYVTGNWIGNGELQSYIFSTDKGTSSDLFSADTQKSEQLKLEMSLFQGKNTNEIVGKINQNFIVSRSEIPLGIDYNSLKVSGSLKQAVLEFVSEPDPKYVNARIEGVFENNIFKGRLRIIYSSQFTEVYPNGSTIVENRKRTLVYSVQFSKKN
jgi:hypothetical protein